MGLTSSKNAPDTRYAAVENAAEPSRRRRGKKRKANVVEDPVRGLSHWHLCRSAIQCIFAPKRLTNLICQFTLRPLTNCHVSVFVIEVVHFHYLNSSHNIILVGRDALQEEVEDDDRVHLRDALQGRQRQRCRRQSIGQELESTQGDKLSLVICLVVN